MLRLCWHVSGNGSGRLHCGSASPPRSIDCSLSGANLVPLPRHVTSWLGSRQQQWSLYICIYIYTYIYIHIYICIYAHSCVRLNVVSVYILCCRAGFQVRRGFFTPDCFVVCLCLIRVGVLACACAYIYIGRIYMCTCIYYKYIHTKSSCVWIDVVCGVHMGLDIYLLIYTQGLHVYIYVYAHRVHMCGYIFTYMHPRFICVCVYITYIHAEFTCACEYDCEYTHKTYICMCIIWRVFTRSLHVCVYMFSYMHAEVYTEFACVCVYGYVYTQRVYTWVCKNIHIYTQCSHVCVYLFVFMGTEFKQACGCVCAYM